MTPAHRHPRPGIALTAGLAALVTVLGACGIPADDRPRHIAQEQLPATSRPADAGGSEQARAVDLWFTRFDGDHDVLTTVTAEVPTASESGRPSPAAVLEALLAGVPEDPDPAVVTKIPADTALADPPVLEGGILTVDLDNGISGVQGDGARLAYGQIVCTVDGLDGVEGVLFTIEGKAVQPPDGRGETGRDPLSCAAYENLGGAPPADP
ncbi:MAG TPA: GerMN domain-containing protein [Acidimicrobiales bacterium]|nr:GerMN domain-containing protein [Acidimicrobiales bacterium]